MKFVLIVFLALKFLFANADFLDIKNSCESNNLDSCYQYAWLHYNENDYSNTKTKNILNKLCNENNHSKSCFDLGNSLYQINNKEYLLKSCNLGYLEACYVLAKISDDCSLMNDTLTKSIKQKDYKVQATIYLGNECIKKNELKAEEISKNACLANDLQACEIYHRVTFQQNHIIKNIIQKTHKECENDIRKCYWLIQIYRFGFLGESKDYDKAAKIAINNCARGNALACFTLADLEQRGYKSNLEEVKEAIKKGCELGNAIMCDFIDGRH